MSRKISVLVVCLVALCSCNRLWKHYEPLVREQPDSALALLRSMNPDRMLSRRERADYFLLLSMAMDKCYIDLTSDSLIKPAVVYFEHRLPKKKRMLAYYYWGRVQSNAHHLAEASLSFDKAGDLALQLGDYLYLGLANQQLGDLYAASYDREHLVSFYERALSAFEQSGKQNYIDNARLELATAYNNNGQREESEALFQSLLQQDSLDIDLRKELYLSYARRLGGMDNNHGEEAYAYFQKADLETFDVSDLGAMAVMAYFAGDVTTSARLMARADSLATTGRDKASVSFDRFRIAHRQGNDTEAIDYLQDAVTIQDSILQQALNQSVSHARSRFFREEAEKQQRRNQTQALFFVLLATFGISTFLIFVHNHRRRIQEDMASLEDIRLQIEAEKEGRAQLANAILAHQMNELNLISEEYFKSDGRARRETYFRAFEKKLDAFRENNADLQELEQSVNMLKDNAIGLLREEIPGQSRHFYKMCTMFFAGFPYDLIHLLTNSSIPTLKATKSHYKKQIQASDAPHRELFLSLLDSAAKKPAGRHKMSD